MINRKRPFGITLLAIAAALAATMAAIHTLQMLHLWPITTLYFGRGVRFFEFNLIGALLWGTLVVIYLWLVQALWRMNPQAWLFLVALASINLLLALLSLLGASTWQAILPTLLINGAILLYCLLPGVKGAFEVPPA